MKKCICKDIFFILRKTIGNFFFKKMGVFYKNLFEPIQPLSKKKYRQGRE